MSLHRALILALFLVALVAQGEHSADAAWKKRQKPAPTYPRVEWRQTQYDNGTVQTQWQVLLKSADEEPIRHGVFRRYHPNGRLALLGSYRMNEPAGVWTWLDDRGNMLRQVRQRQDYDDEILGEETRSPLSTFRNPAGVTTAEGQMKADTPHGHWVFYYSNGAPKAEGMFLSGAADGEWNYYLPNGQIDRQMHFSLGVPNGAYRSAYPDGQEQERGRYDQGVRTGVWRTWYPNGQLHEEGEYTQNQREGEWREWSEDGRLLAHRLYRNGIVAAEIPLPQPPMVKEPVIPDENRLPIAPHVYDENGRWIRPYDEEREQAPPPPKLKGRRAPKPAPLTQWQGADRGRE